uniref:Uncharacterized protein n=1 Tax=Cyprinus carpio carpio TaxID=630221 RepID=A0A9J7ZPE8_CYPCA
LRHTVRPSLSQLSAVLVKHETPDRRPVGLLLLSKVVGSNLEPFKPHYKQLLQLFGTVLQDLNNATALYYRILTLTAITATEEMNLMQSLIPKLLIDQASEALEVFDELMESEVSIVVPHIAEILLCNNVYFVSSRSVRMAPLVILCPILQVVFPILSVIDTMALHMPPEKSSTSCENSYEGKGGLMCMAVLAEVLLYNYAYISTHIHMSRSLSDENHVVRCAALFALGQFSEHLHALENFLENLVVNTVFFNVIVMLRLMISLSFSANAAKELLTLSVLAHAVGKEVFSPLAEECVQLGLNLTDAVDDLDLRCCTYSLFSAVCDVSPDCLAPQLTPITSVMLLSLTSTEGVTASEDFSLRSSVHHQTLRNTNQDSVYSLKFSVENAYIDEKEDACDALGEITFNTGCYQCECEMIFFNYPEFFDQLLHISLYIFPALHKLLQVVLPCFLGMVRQDRERQVVMAILESMNAVIKSCQGEALQAPGILAKTSNTIKDVLKKKVRN